MNDRASVLLIYTGGTIGMWADPRTGVLRPMDLAHLEEQVPELQRIKVNLESVAFDRPMDSSDLGPLDWVRIARDDREALRSIRWFRGPAWERYHGLHGQCAQLLA